MIVQQRWTRSPRVLILEDDAIIGSLLAERLTENGFHVAQFSSARELEDVEFTPDVSVLDIRLRDDWMSGFEAAVLLKKRFPACRFVLISGSQDAAECAKAYSDAGLEFKFLAKPFGTKALLDVMHQDLAHLRNSSDPSALASN